MIMALQEELEMQGNWLFRRRSLLPLVILWVGVAAAVLSIRTRGVLFASVFPYWHLYEYLCLAVGLAGTLVRIYTVGHTPVGTSGRNTEGQVADVLNTTGIYSTVRHPLYLGNFLMWLGIALLTCNVGFIAAFIPCFKRFRPNGLPFSWKKVIKKEKNGVFALFLLFSLFDGIVAWLGDIRPNYVLLALTVVSGIAYLILKYIKKHTGLLDEKGR